MRRTFRLMPVSIYEITQVEAYFTHMASKGYFVKKVGLFATFEKGTAEETKYRLEPYGKKTKEPPQEMLLFYEEQGWEYVCKTNFFLLYQSTRADATEIHTDPVAQGETFEKIHRDLRAYFWISTVLYLISGGMVFYTTFCLYPIYSNIKFGTKIASITVIILFILGICQTLGDYRKIKKLKGKLEAGVVMIHNETYNPPYRHYFSLAFPLILLFIMFAITHYDTNAYWEKNLSQYEGNLPTISITAIETSPDFSYVSNPDFDEVYANYISYHYSELTTEAFNVEEKGQIEGQMWEDNSGPYSPFMETEYYRLRFQFLAEPLFNELIANKTTRHHYQNIEYHQLSDTKFDQATMVSADKWQMLFARTGKKVIFIQYYGREKLASMVDEVYKAVYDFSGTQ